MIVKSKMLDSPGNRRRVAMLKKERDKKKVKKK